MEWGSTPLRAEVPHFYRDAFVPQVLDVDIIGATGSRCYNSGSAGASHGPHSGDACDGDFGATLSGMGGK